MPYSLWFIPLNNNPFTKTARELISDTVPRQFLSEDKYNIFEPHVTITSDVDIGSQSPQEWLDALQLPDFKPEHDEVILELDSVEVEDPFFRKMNVKLSDNANLKKVAAICREKGTGVGEAEAKKWAEGEYRPHMSLLYADIPTSEVKGETGAMLRTFRQILTLA